MSGVSVMVASFVSSIPGLIALVGAIAGLYRHTRILLNTIYAPLYISEVTS